MGGCRREGEAQDIAVEIMNLESFLQDTRRRQPILAARFARWTNIGRAGFPEAVVELVVLPASNRAISIHGGEHVDGGIGPWV